ncbi:peptidylprolyl isomerase [Sphingomonas sp. Leaf357]|uniref:peptidylprolyl isomerase n=1 Tax=Sphingomonas sp. Leaf357 TaxID=1736350 RepID=UPI0006FAA9C7|nr:peptidylprolyl isomerase [Sphingomonas sp. Leaf357]KQS04633.1 peptidylprolyl isomerase [Sphingomonas sp. Leaf357]
MLSVIRGIIHSKVGLVIAFALLAMLVLSFAGGDLANLTKGTGDPKSTTLAKVGKGEVTVPALTQEIQSQVQNYAQQQPGLDVVKFVAGGGFEPTLDRSIVELALQEFGQKQGMVISKKLIDGQIAGVPSLQGPDGKFSQAAYEQLLSQQGLTDRGVREGLVKQLIGRQLIFPILPAAQVAQKVALPYASLLLEKRQGEMGFIPTKAMGDGAPATDAEVASWYARNLARYTIPERRVIRYAMVTNDQIKAQTTPTEAELAAAYKAQARTFTATEKRDLVQVIVADQAAANALIAKVKAGTPLDAAARAAGLEPTKLTALDKVGYAAQSSPAAADAVFAAAKGALVGPVRSAIGFALVRVDKVEQVPGKTLEQAKPELIASVTKTKTLEVLGRIHDAIDDSVSNNHATFDDIMTQQKLSPQATPPLLADGRDPNDPTKKAAPDFMPIVTAAFAANPSDAPQMVQVDPTGGFAVVALGRVVAPGAPPVAQIRAVVARDFQIDRARRAARTIANDIVAKANKGQPFASLFAASGVKTPPVQPLNTSRAQMAANPRGAPPPLVLMFSMAENSAKLLEAPDNQGWYVIKLDKIDRGNATGNAAVIRATQGDLGKLVGREYTEQFTNAVRDIVGVKKNAAAIAALKAQLLGQTAAN